MGSRLDCGPRPVEISFFFIFTPDRHGRKRVGLEKKFNILLVDENGADVGFGFLLQYLDRRNSF